MNRSTNNFNSICDDIDRINNRTELLEQRGYKDKWYDTFDYQFRALLFLIFIFLPIMYYLLLSK